MKYLLHILLLFVWVQGAAFAQEPFDSVRWEEMEDSLGSVTIKPVKHPKRLLKQVINRIHKDLQEAHQGRSYRVEGTFRKGSSPPFSASCIYHVEGDNGLEIAEPLYRDTNNIKAPQLEDLCYEGLYKLNTQDSISMRFNLIALLQFSPSHSSNHYTGIYYPVSPFVYYEETARWYNVEAYEFDDGSDRGAYRILLEKKKDRNLWKPGDRNFWIPDIKFTAYFDRRALRITKIRCQHILKKGNPYPFNNVDDMCIRYQADYDEEMGTPVLKQIRYIQTSDKKGISGTVRRIDE